MSLSTLRKTLRDRVWFLLEANTDFTAQVRVGNRQKLDTPSGWVKALLDLQAPADFPKLRITDGRVTSSAFQEAATFAEESSSYLDSGEDWPLKMTVEFMLEPEVDLRQPQAEDPLFESIQTALLKGGPRLGLADVLNWSMQDQRKPRTPEQARKAGRLASSLRLTINLLLNGRSIIGS